MRPILRSPIKLRKITSTKNLKITSNRDKRKNRTIIVIKKNRLLRKRLGSKRLR